MRKTSEQIRQEAQEVFDRYVKDRFVTKEKHPVYYLLNGVEPRKKWELPTINRVTISVKIRSLKRGYPSYKDYDLDSLVKSIQKQFIQINGFSPRSDIIDSHLSGAITPDSVSIRKIVQ